MTEPVVSVVTVTFNNATGLKSTLASLAALRQKPLEILIVDGGSRDDTAQVVREFEEQLPIVFASEPDEGIYDAMNKGLARARGQLLHYLNAGDCVVGEPYAGVQRPSRMDVQILDEGGRVLFRDFVKLGGYGYCHQGILFPAGHAPYRTQFRISADLDLIISLFPAGLDALPLQTQGGVGFGLGGVSTQRVSARDREIRRILRYRLPWHRAGRLALLLWAKSLIPRGLRRWIVSRRRLP